MRPERGFIGHHLVNRFKDEGFWVRGVDRKAPEFGKTGAFEFHLLDLRCWENCLGPTNDVDEVPINELVGIVARIAGKKVDVKHIAGPMGVRDRNRYLSQ